MSTTLNPIRLKNAADEIGRLRETVLEIFVDRLKQIERGNILRVVLFGSVARGDSEPDSDIDVFILTEQDKTGLKELNNRILDISLDIESEEGDCKVHISPFVEAAKDYEMYAWLPIFQAIREEGVVLYDAAR